MSSETPQARKQRTEYSQSITRIILGTIVLVIVSTVDFFDVYVPHQNLVIWTMVAYFLYSVIVYIAVRRHPQPLVWRRGVSIICDIIFASIAIGLAGSLGGAFYPIYLWIIVGNGLRFGVPYMLFAMITGIAGFSTMVITSYFWSQHSPLAIGLIIGMVMLPMFYMVILRELDVANRSLQKQKEMAEQADFAKSRFLAAASHDLRQPLQAQALFVAELYERLHDPKKSFAILEKLDDSVSAMRELFNALLDISKLDAGVVRPKVRHFMISSLLNVIEDEYVQQAQARGLEFNVCCSDTAVHTDPGLLDSVLRNLVVNAIRYTNIGKIMIECHIDNGYLVIEVKDTGIGIESRHLEEIFQEFFQVENPQRNRDQGLGLGLSIVRRIANLLDCSVQVRSTMGVGSYFCINVPLGDANAISPDTELNSINATHVLDGINVIVIDDDRAIQEAMGGLLESWGCHVLVAGAGDEMLFKVSESIFSPDIIIADYRLPGSMTGIQAITEIRKHLKRDIPAILITGDIAIEKLQDVSVSEIPSLHKPIKPGRLRTLMHHLNQQYNNERM